TSGHANPTTPPPLPTIFLPLLNLRRNEKAEVHCRIIRRQQINVGSLELRHHSSRSRRNGQRHISPQHSLNNLGTPLKINQIDTHTVFFEETFFLSNVGLAELSGEKRGHPYSPVLRPDP